MKTIGLIGGMSWQSTALYYKLINEGVRDLRGPLSSAEIILYSFNFAPIKAMQDAGDWRQMGDMLAEAALRLERGGADMILLCTNTMHKLADAIETRVTVPFLNLADCTADRVAAAGVKRVALLGTRFTMAERFYSERLERRGLEVLVPNAEESDAVNRIIFDELCAGIVLEASRQAYVSIVARLAAEGAEAVILGCTEIAMLIGAEDVAIPIFDTTAIHAQAAVDMALT